MLGEIRGKRFSKRTVPPTRPTDVAIYSYVRGHRGPLATHGVPQWVVVAVLRRFIKDRRHSGTSMLYLFGHRPKFEMSKFCSIASLNLY